MRFSVEVASLVREVRSVVVEASSREELEERLSEVYEQACEQPQEWTDDVEWGCEEGTHTIIGETELPVDIVLKPAA